MGTRPETGRARPAARRGSYYHTSLAASSVGGSVKEEYVGDGDRTFDCCHAEPRACDQSVDEAETS